ncbi:MAG: hypothetical protein ABIQ31_16450 [Ferruginibacter sp.]
MVIHQGAGLEPYAVSSSYYYLIFKEFLKKILSIEEVFISNKEDTGLEPCA